MRRRRIIVGTAFAFVAALAFAGGTAIVLINRPFPARARSVAPSPARTVQVSCPSPSLGGTLPALVYLPAGYGSSSRRYRVIYFLHGLPAGPTTYTQYSFVADELAAAGLQAIVVTPQGARAPGSDREYLDWSSTEDWPQAISHDLPRCIDARYRTIANRYGRALIGLSAGGYGAFNIGLRHLSTFSSVESWSGYFAATDPSGLHILDLGSPALNRAAAVPSGSELAAADTRWPTLIAFYVGNQDTRFLQMNIQFDAELKASEVPHLFYVYPGGHSGALWRGQAPHWLAMALDYMTWAAHHRPRNGAGGL